MWNIGSFSFERLHAPVRRFRVRLREVKFSFACQKRTRKAPAISTRWIHEKGAARPFQTPKGLSKRKKASRCAKTGCGSQRLLRCRSHPAGRCPNSFSLFPPLAAVVAVALFSRFSDLLLRSGCYALAGREVQQKGKIFGEAVKRRRAKMRLRDLRANARISSIFAWSLLLRNR